jgi:CRP/FNR family transcriptional regulator, anaerobic regulatory protein
MQTVLSRLVPASRRPQVAATPRNDHCADCRSKAHCWPSGCMDALELHYAHRRVKRGETLYRTGDEFVNLYAVRSGTFKTRTLMEDGRDQVMSFPMSGDLLGLDGIESRQHRTDCIALEDSEVCILPYEQIMSTAQTKPWIMRDLYSTMSREILHDHGVMNLLGSMRADERVVAFLLNLSDRLQQRGYSPSCFILRMTREEIGSYLGLQLETVSRVFGRLQDAGQVSITNNRHITLLDPEGIKTFLSRNYAADAHVVRVNLKRSPGTSARRPVFNLPSARAGMSSRPAVAAFG